MRLLFRVLMALTLLFMFLLGRMNGGKLFPLAFVAVFLQWFAVSVFVFAVFGLRSVWLAWRDPANRRAYLFDILLAAAWVPYWYINLKK